MKPLTRVVWQHWLDLEGQLGGRGPLPLTVRYCLIPVVKLYWVSGRGGKQGSKCNTLATAATKSGLQQLHTSLLQHS